MTAAVLMVQGCASSVGKSLITTGLCRLFHREGLSVAPFKAQNLALNSFVTLDGGEIGRAQAVQAEACGIEPTVDMNPVLLKPEGDSRSQVVLMGKPISRTEARDHYRESSRLKAIVAASLARLRQQFELVLIEGAGSPAEINLRDRDIVNMHVARTAKAPVLLVGDIDRGGVFAHLAGTLALLDEDDRAQVAGLVINKFHGDRSLLDPGIRMIEERLGLPVLGVVPHVGGLCIAEEDSVALDQRRGLPRGTAGELEIAVVRFPRISNHDDFMPLEHEPGVVVRYVERAQELAGADLVILPGTKDTRGDLRWLREVGMDRVVAARARRGQALLGICGGYQMLGRTIEDPEGLEGPAGSERGLGLLPVSTRFGPEKTTLRVGVRPGAGDAPFLTRGVAPDCSLDGYEIHMGEVTLEPEAPGLFVHEANGRAEGTHRGAVVGTLMHGLFENVQVRRALLEQLGSGVIETDLASADADYDRLADVLEASLDMPAIRELLEAPWPRAGGGASGVE